MYREIKYLLIFCLLTSSCQKKYFPAKGKFFDGLSFSEESYFSHEYGNNQNQLKKITDNGYGYYAWKTIKYNYNINNRYLLLDPVKDDADTVNISIYKTLSNEELMNFDLDQLSYIQKEGNVLMNNLFFLDDYRCMYISYDDNRNDTIDNEFIPLYFDRDHYKIPRSSKKRFDQYLRGYYTVKGDSIFIHFENPFKGDNFYVKGSWRNDNIQFNAMTIPNSPNDLYEEGFNARRINFKDVFHSSAQPIFEWVEPLGEIIYPQMYNVTFGFEYSIENRRPSNKLHQAIMRQNPGNELDCVYVIDSISYDLTNEYEYSRTYFYHKLGMMASQLEVVEKIGLSPIGDLTLIDTW